LPRGKPQKTLDTFFGHARDPHVRSADDAFKAGENGVRAAFRRVAAQPMMSAAIAWHEAS